jgi:hypothetical protein
MKRETARFRAAGDDHWIYTVVVWAEFFPPKNADGSAGETRGVSEFRPDTGGHVKRLDQDRYQVVASGVVLTPIDPPTA